jgi:UDP-perosamine 4-acetyltransferase
MSVAEAPAGKIVIAGAGGHAKVVIELVRAACPALEIVGMVDAERAPRSMLGVPVIGGDNRLADLRAGGVAFAFPAVGDNALRERLGERLRKLGFELPALVSPKAAVSPTARLGAGVAVMAGAAINAEAAIADFAVVNTGAVVDHDARLGLAAHAAPGSVLAGGSCAGARALIGAGAVLIPGVSVGDDAVIGAGAAVVADIPAASLAVGVPARVVRRIDGTGTRHV